MIFLSLAQICEINPSKAIDLPDHFEISFVPMECVSADGYVDLSRTIEITRIKNYSVFKDGDILFAKITPCMENGKGAIVEGLKNGYGVGSTEFIVLRPNKNLVSAKWVYLFLSQAHFRFECQQNMTGSAGQKRVSPKYLATCLIPVPPLDEQERIVARIEELFSQLDSGVETLRKAKQQLAVYRQAVLKEAFEGDYPKKQLKDFSKAISGYAFKSSRYSPDGHYIVVKIGNVKERRFDFTRDLTKTTEADDSILEKYLLQRGDCLITLTGSRGKRDYGFVAMVGNQKNYLLNQRVAALRFDQSVALPEFFQYYLASPLYRDMFFSYETGNVGQGNVGIKALLDPYVILPDIETQKRIVDVVEVRLSVCDSIDQALDMALQQAKAMRQSILKQAFEGAL